MANLSDLSKEKTEVLEARRDELQAIIYEANAEFVIIGKELDRRRQIQQARAKVASAGLTDTEIELATLEE